jgi:hypothetical protein
MSTNNNSTPLMRQFTVCHLCMNGGGPDSCRRGHIDNTVTYRPISPSRPNPRVPNPSLESNVESAPDRVRR